MLGQASGVRLSIVTLCAMAEAIEPVRHTGAGVARRQAFHERQRAERAQQDAAGAVVLPAE